MQLTSLEIKGFKSFGDKVTINFDEGVTSIVGPNGCGKSNVVDAIRWVLGEQSTRMLRSDKMENIIFNGTNKRRASNLAEVSLTFNNSKNILPTEFTTVTITRKLYRSGESEYRLNGVKCRLKDITDLFLDTGIGTNSYSIIELKMVDEIINNKENSRKNLFEEASGISKYKLRKKQTLAKIKETDSDLSRVEDILYEINKNLKSLESQAKKADRYTKIKAEYKEASIALAYYTIEQYAEELDNLQLQKTSHSDKLQNLDTQIVQCENELQLQKQEVINKEKNLSVQQKATNEYIYTIQKYESDKRIKNEEMKFLRERESRIISELENDRQQLSHTIYTLKRLNEDSHSQEISLDQIKNIVTTSQSQVDALKGQQQTAKIKLDTLKNKIGKEQSNFHELEKKIAVLKIQQEALQEELQRNTLESKDKIDELSQFSSQLKQLDDVYHTQYREYEKLSQVEKKLQEQISKTEDHNKETSSQIHSLQRTFDSKQNEYSLTKSLIDNLEGFPESIRFLKKNAGWRKTFPLFSDTLFCQEEYRIAIENYLEPFMNHYIVDKQEEAVHAIELLQKSLQGKASFFILDRIPDIIEKTTPIADGLIPVLDVVQIDDKYHKLCLHLLQGVYLQKDKGIDSHSSTQTLLQSDGSYINHPLGLSGGSIGLFEGKRIGRAKNLDILKKEINTLKKELSKLHDTLLQNQKALTRYKSQSVKQDIDSLNHQITQSQNLRISLQAKYDQYQLLIETNKSKKDKISEKSEEIQSQLIGLEDDYHNYNIVINTSEQELLYLQENFDHITEDLAEVTGFFNQENIRYHQQHNKVQTLAKDIEYKESQKDTLEQRLDKNTIELQKNHLAIQEAITYVDHNDADLLEMYAQRESLEKGLKDLEKDYYAYKNKIQTIETKVHELRQSKDKVNQVLNEIRDHKTQLQISLNSLRERLAIEFEINIQDLLNAESIPHQINQKELEALTIRLKNQLNDFGSINPMAKEAYDQINERLQFITNEKQDLIEAKSALLATIHEIDETANHKFMTAFNAVRQNFIDVFRSLFNDEDSCDLLLIDPSNPLESEIEIIARPKGKKPLSINQLSGGEKTLTAIALLFSLYLSKPAPFCIFDEVDAPLDDTNIDKFNTIIREFSAQSQFIIVSHNKRTIASTDIIYGITMLEPGISKVVAVDLREVS